MRSNASSVTPGESGINRPSDGENLNSPFFFFFFLSLKATNERQDDGVGILHQVAQFPTIIIKEIYRH